MRLRLLLIITAAGLLAWAAPGRAQTAVTAPGVRVITEPDAPGGPRVFVKVPGVRVNVGDPPPPVVVTQPPPVVVTPYPPPPPPPVVVTPYPPPAVVVPQPPPPVVVQPPPPPAVVVTPAPAVRAVTLEEFARTFRPAPGTWQVTLIHPRTGAALPVTFTLPPGVPRVIVGPRAVEFDYGRSRVVIAVTITGGFRVRTI